MIPILSNKQAKLVDLLCVKNRYTTQKKLMDKAGMLSAQFFVEKVENPFNKKVLIVAGKGNNGSDAIIMHHYLLRYGVNSNLFIIDSADKDLIDRYKISNKLIIKDLNKEIVNGYDWVVDGIFGIGINRSIVGKYKNVIQVLNGQNIISLDIPSGLCSDTGEPISHGVFVKAKYVLSMGFYKYGNIINQSKVTFNKTKVLDIGFPKISKFIDDIKIYLIEKKDIKDIVINEDFLRNKFSGLCSMIVGSKQYSGAGLLSLLGSLKSGASYARVVSPEKVISSYLGAPESVIFPIKNSEFFNKSSYSSIIKSGILSDEKPILIGPGLGGEKQTTQLTSKILDYLKDKSNNCILDASGFEPLYQDRKIEDLPKNCILTPHLGEFVKIFHDIDFTKALAKHDKIFKKLNGRVLVLKGPTTFIFTKTEKVYVLNNGNSLLATAGSGDVLSGMILGLLSKGYGLDEAALLAVYVHALASQKHFQIHSKHSMLATDIIQHLPVSFDEIYS